MHPTWENALQGQAGPGALKRRTFSEKYGFIGFGASFAVREFAYKSAASAASLDYVKFQAVIKSAASAASLRGGRASGRLDHGFFFAIFGRASGQKIIKK